MIDLDDMTREQLIGQIMRLRKEVDRLSSKDIRVPEEEMTKGEKVYIPGHQPYWYYNPKEQTCQDRK